MTTTTDRPSTVSALARNDALTIDKLAVELTRRQQTKHDLIVDTRRIGFYAMPSGTSLVTVDGAEDLTPWQQDVDGNQVQGFVVNDYAHGQISDRLGIPKRYYDRMRGTAHDLLQENVRHWLTNDPKRQMVRTLDGNVRAFLSDRYRRLDDFDLMEHLLPTFAEIDGLTFQVAALTDTRLHIRALLPRIEREVKVGDTVQAGIEIKNSEVGAGALTISPFVWRLICLNGMVMPTAVRRNHVGGRIEEDDLGRYRSETIAQDDKAFFMKVADVVRSTLTEVAFDEIVAKLREAATGERIVAPAAATERLAKTYDLGEGEQQSVLAHLASGGDLSRWGMVNAITAAAKDADGWDRLSEMEAIGGTLATIPETDWSRLALTTA